MVARLRQGESAIQAATLAGQTAIVELLKQAEIDFEAVSAARRTGRGGVRSLPRHGP